jgi:hypothetical protein
LVGLAGDLASFKNISNDIANTAIQQFYRWNNHWKMESWWRSEFETTSRWIRSQNEQMSQAEKCNCDIIIFYQLQRTRKAIIRTQGGG